MSNDAQASSAQDSILHSSPQDDGEITRGYGATDLADAAKLRVQLFGASDKTVRRSRSSSEDRRPIIKFSRPYSDPGHPESHPESPTATMDNLPGGSGMGRSNAGRDRSISWSSYNKRRHHPRITEEGGSFYLMEAEDPNDFNIIEAAENDVEARKMLNNHMVSETIISGSLYHDRDNIKKVQINFSNR
ncbi:hypothetical protein PoB_001664000 [Plakobranchus ocellatus]|uniref:Uncharacterized protein n=1 Tax=Plakobranchus ocellatus TaxID=259542 RepID=A0AAV3Z4Q7_9GAST|nr:hypothetical protein PoB_001664000 [Plakobranchus ocellatus]